MQFTCKSCSHSEPITQTFKSRYIKDGYLNCPMCDHPVPIKRQAKRPEPIVEQPPELLTPTFEPPEPITYSGHALESSPEGMLTRLGYCSSFFYVGAILTAVIAAMAFLFNFIRLFEGGSPREVELVIAALMTIALTGISSVIVSVTIGALLEWTVQIYKLIDESKQTA